MYQPEPKSIKAWPFASVKVVVVICALLGCLAGWWGLGEDDLRVLLGQAAILLVGAIALPLVRPRWFNRARALLLIAALVGGLFFLINAAARPDLLGPAFLGSLAEGCFWEVRCHERAFGLWLFGLSGAWGVVAWIILGKKVAPTMTSRAFDDEEGPL
jgi:hypothetical protein